MIPEAPIFTAWYDLGTWLLERADAFPKHKRLTYAQHLVRLCLKIEEEIVQALYSSEKLELLEGLNRRLAVLRIFTRRCKDMKLLSIKQYEHASRKIDEVGRMLGGWIKQQKLDRKAGKA